MNILTCWVPGANRILPEVEAALRLHSTDDCNWRRVELDPDNAQHYGQVIRDFWRAADDDLVILEPDIEVGPTTIFDFRACSHSYCGNPYEVLTDVMVCLGCTRFRRQFMLDFPNAVDEALATNVGFRQFDVVFQRMVLLGKFKRSPHVHHQVIHRNAAKALLPTANPEPLREMPAMFGALLGPG